MVNQPRNYVIVPLVASNAFHLPLQQEPIDVLGHLIPIFDGNKWLPQEALLEKPTQKTYPTEVFDPMDYVDKPKQAGFLAMFGNECVGVIRVSDRWQKMPLSTIWPSTAHTGERAWARV